MDLVDINKRFPDWNLPKSCPCPYYGYASLCSEMRRFQKFSSRFWVVKTHQKIAMKPDFRLRISVSRNRTSREQEYIFRSSLPYYGYASLCSEMRRFEKFSSRIRVVKTNHKLAMKPDFRFRSSGFRNHVFAESEFPGNSSSEAI